MPAQHGRHDVSHMLILNPAARPTTMPQNKSRNPPQSHNVACIHAACMRDGKADIGHGENMRVMRASDHQIRRAAVIATGLFATPYMHMVGGVAQW